MKNTQVARTWQFPLPEGQIGEDGETIEPTQEELAIDIKTTNTDAEAERERRLHPTYREELLLETDAIFYAGMLERMHLQDLREGFYDF